MRKYLCVGAMLALMVVLAGCGGSATSSGGAGSPTQSAEFRLGTMVWDDGVSAKTNGWIQTGLMESLVVQGLVEMGTNGQPKPGLASSIEHPNPTTYVYNVRKGVRFSNGEPLTVADAVYSLDLNKGHLFTVSEAWNKDVASVSARGNSAVVVKLKRPNPDWSDIMVEASGVVEKAAGEKVSESEFGKPRGLPIGTGPWKFDSYVPEASVKFSRNPYWNGPSQPIATINVTQFKSEATMALALQSGAIDAASVYGSQKLFAHIPSTHQLGGQQDVITWMSMHTSSPPLSDVHVRRAIAYATEVNAIIRTLYPGGGASADPSVIPVPLFGSMGSPSQVNTMIATLQKYEFNLGKAKQELAKSAYPHGFMTVLRYFSGEPILGNIAQIVASDLAKIGITVQIKPMQADETALPSEKKTAPMLLNEYEGFVPNGASILMSYLLAPSNIYPSGVGTNWPLYNNAELGKLLPEVASTVNQAARLQLAGKALRIAAAEEPYLPLFMHSVFIQMSNKYSDPDFSFFTAYYSPWMMNMKLAG
ncbi:MAG TPA: ABC transporter substrate-binding protein [Solirubrobacteraceae bacterium]|jgi:peptide/nickel transport system substrate-binding protein|nr:ABC transporter substrate-binding protein [Solirubrobacteraceae bacterium]